MPKASHDLISTSLSQLNISWILWEHDTYFVSCFKHNSWQTCCSIKIYRISKLKSPLCSFAQDTLFFGKIPCRRECLLTPVFLSGESHEQRSLAGYSPCSRRQLDTTEQWTLDDLITVSSMPFCTGYTYLHDSQSQ